MKPLNIMIKLMESQLLFLDKVTGKQNYIFQKPIN